MDDLLDDMISKGLASIGPHTTQRYGISGATVAFLKILDCAACFKQYLDGSFEFQDDWYYDPWVIQN